MYDEEAVCRVTVHSCRGVDDFQLLKRKIKTSHHKIAADEALFTIPQIKASGQNENAPDMLSYLSKKSTTGPVETLSDNAIDIFYQSRSAAYQAIRRAKEGLHFY